MKAIAMKKWPARYSAVDIERTMQFILDSQAKSEVRMERLERREAKTDRRIRCAGETTRQADGRHNQAAAAGYEDAGPDERRIEGIGAIAKRASSSTKRNGSMSKGPYK